MQKIVMIALVFLGLGVSAVFGSVTKQETMSEAEAQYLFGSGSDDSVSLLSVEEMKETEGEWILPVFIWSYRYYRSVPWTWKAGYTYGFGWASSKAY